MTMQRIVILKGMRDPYSLYMCGSLFLFSRAFEKSAGLLVASDFTTHLRQSTSLENVFQIPFSPKWVELSSEMMIFWDASNQSCNLHN